MADCKRLTGLEFGSGSRNLKAHVVLADDVQETPGVWGQEVGLKRRLFDGPAIPPALSPQSPAPAMNDNLLSTAVSRRSGFPTYIPHKRNPWNTYAGILEVLPKATVALRSDRDQHYAISRTPGSAKAPYLQVINRLAHELRNPLVDIVETYDWKGELYIVTNFIDISLTQIRNGQKPLSEQHLSYLMHEIVNALIVLAQHGVYYGPLVADNVLITTAGHIKLAPPESWEPAPMDEPKRTNITLVNIMVQLMERQALFSSHEFIHLENPEVWSSEARSFLAYAQNQTLSAIQEVFLPKDRSQNCADSVTSMHSSHLDAKLTN
ncbi:hypothetical protein OHC33_011031 [Knufia fluminis]|uniref:Protein kinase domain-containing protein n=1 Tax=Knufia fluminis TaxID=191047 RepID=A0AAN8EIL1_9EURO|nr:hypothetical protein OHC33_011031 [Knufia fluminis]